MMNFDSDFSFFQPDSKPFLRNSHSGSVRTRARAICATRLWPLAPDQSHLSQVHSSAMQGMAGLLIGFDFAQSFSALSKEGLLKPVAILHSK